MTIGKLKRLSSLGFSHVEMFIVAVVIVAVAGVGYHVFANEAHAGSWTNVATITSDVHTTTKTEDKCQASSTGRAAGIKASYVTAPVNGTCPRLLTLGTKNVPAVTSTVQWCNADSSSANPAGLPPVVLVVHLTPTYNCPTGYKLGTKTETVTAATTKEWCSPNATGVQAGVSAAGVTPVLEVFGATKNYACPILLTSFKDAVPVSVVKGTLTVYACEENATAQEDSAYGSLWIVKAYATSDANAQKYAAVTEPGTSLTLTKLSLKVYRPGQPPTSGTNRAYTAGDLQLVQSPTPVALTSSNGTGLASSAVTQTFASQLRYGATAAKIKGANGKTYWENNANAKTGQGTNGVGDQFRISLVNSRGVQYYPDTQAGWNFQAGSISPDKLSHC